MGAQRLLKVRPDKENNNINTDVLGVQLTGEEELVDVAEPKQHQPDVYGQIHPIETPEMIENAHQELDIEITKLPQGQQNAIQLAERTCPEIASLPFRLAFLRAEVFNAKLAAQRYGLYWVKRIEIFGNERAFQPIILKNMTQNEIALGFKSQLGHILTDTQTGRKIFYADCSKICRASMSNMDMIRIVWYILHTFVDDIESQKKGAILMTNAKNYSFSQFGIDFCKQLVESIKGCVPVRLSAFHVLHPPTFVRYVYPIISIVLNQRIRQRMLIHTFSTDDQKILKRLKNKYGMNPNDLPKQIGGSVELNTEKWLAEQLAAGK
jgi:CRAL/TRIO domain